MVKSICIFSGLSNKAPSRADTNAPTVIIEGFMLFSGFDVKVKKTIKETFVSFADSLKKMFN